MKSRSELWLTALEELGAVCSVSTTKDRETFLRRIEGEGDSFVTITLPSYAKDLERALELKRIPSDLFPQFARKRESILAFNPLTRTEERITVGGAPKFLGGFMDHLFEVVPLFSVVDSLGDDAPGWVSIPYLKTETAKGPWQVDFPKMAEAIWAIRQLCLMFSKEKALCPQEKIDDALASYAEVDQELDLPLRDGRAETLFEGARLARTRSVVRVLFGDQLARMDKMIFEGNLNPRHGPGATADSVVGNQKWHFKEWPDVLEHLFPYWEYGIPNARYSYLMDQVKFLKPGTERSTKIVAVPKTQDKPRLIAEEPTVMQYIQQAISRPLVALLEEHPVSSHFIGFTDQVPNQTLAHFGSDEGTLATLDLSDASDRVANWLVEELFADFPYFCEGIQACRTPRAKTPSGDIIYLQKFASMGSALTFPIEAMVFLAIIFERILNAADKGTSRKEILSFRDQVRVYGDDIIVPTDMAVAVIDGLETLGFKVNHRKSFWNGRFRESCGKEYWAGFDVSVVKVRSEFPNSLRCATEVISAVETRNLFYEEGLLATAAWYDSWLEPLLKGHFPIVAPTSPVLGRIDHYISYDIGKTDDQLHAPRVKGYVIVAKSPKNEIDDVPALLKTLVTPGVSSEDPEHLTRSGRPRAVRLKLAWASPF